MARTEPGPARRRGVRRAGACHPAAPVVEEPAGVRRPAALREVHRDRRAGRCRGRLRRVHAGSGRHLPRQRRARRRERPRSTPSSASPGRGGHPGRPDRRAGPARCWRWPRCSSRCSRARPWSSVVAIYLAHLPGSTASRSRTSRSSTSPSSRAGSSCGRSPAAPRPGSSSRSGSCSPRRSARSSWPQARGTPRSCSSPRAGRRCGASLASYSPSYLRFVWTVSAGLLIMTYGLWAFELGEAAGGSWWYVASMAPFVLAVLRYALDVDRGTAGEPEELALRDRTLEIFAVCWLVMVAIAVYCGLTALSSSRLASRSEPLRAPGVRWTDAPAVRRRRAARGTSRRSRTASPRWTSVARHPSSSRAGLTSNHIDCPYMIQWYGAKGLRPRAALTPHGGDGRTGRHAAHPRPGAGVPAQCFEALRAWCRTARLRRCRPPDRDARPPGGTRRRGRRRGRTGRRCRRTRAPARTPRRRSSRRGSRRSRAARDPGSCAAARPRRRVLG